MKLHFDSRKNIYHNLGPLPPKKFGLPLTKFFPCFLQVLKTVRKEVLKDCKIVFSRVFPTKFQPENHLLWKMAEQLGATCSTETDSSVTHVVSMDAGTEKSRWAVKENKFLVHPRWIEAANFFWQKQPEEKFPVSQTKN